ncbi:MAG: HlyD family efflux transporter periplasmic adaptor subunit [Bacteroidota bacterium]
MKTISKKTKTMLLVILGSVVSLALISYQFKEEPEKSASDKRKSEENISQEEQTVNKIKKTDLRLITVQVTDKAIKQPISGRIVPKNTTQLFSEVQGKVLSQGFKLKEGISFRKGESLMRLDAKEFRLQLEAQKSAFLNILTGMMSDLKADYPDNYSNWLNYVQAYKSGESLAELPKTESDGEEYYVTSNQIYSTYYNIKSLEERLSKFNIIAPYDGSVTIANTDKGTLVSPGQMLGTIINNRSYELEAAAGIEVVTKLKVGDKITFSNNQLSGSWMGTVVRISEIIDTKTQNIPVYFDIQGPNLKAGMYLEGFFMSESFENVFSIPSAMLTRDEKVLLLDNNVIRGKAVELVEFMQDSILVRGLSSDDLLIANQFNIPVEGMKISLN